MDNDLLEFLSAQHGDLNPSPEDILSSIEDKLESGELTLTEAIQWLADFNRRAS